MKNQVIGAFFALSLFQWFSCSHDVERKLVDSETKKSAFLSDNNLDELRALAVSPQRSKDEALSIAQQMTRSTTRSLSVNKWDFDIDVVVANQSPKTYSTISEELESVDTLLYVLNRKNNNGFFVVSGDKRLPDVLCFSLEGHLDKDSIEGNSAFSVFLSRLPGYYQSTLDRFNERLDSLEALEYNASPLSSIGPKRSRTPEYRYEYSEWREVERMPNLVPVTWHQNYPFNNEAPLINNQRALSGCVAIAAAQLLTAFKYPNSYEGMTLDWDFLTKYSKSYSYAGQEVGMFVKQAAPLLRKIGDKLGNSWGINATGAKTERISELLRDMGYSHTSSITPYNIDGVISSISQKKSCHLRRICRTA